MMGGRQPAEHGGGGAPRRLLGSSESICLFPKRDCVGLRVGTCGGECIRYLTHGRIFSLRGKGHQKPAKGWGLLPNDDDDDDDVVVVVGLAWRIGGC